MTIPCNLTGETPQDRLPKVLIPKGVYVGEITGISGITALPKYQKPDETEDKVRMEVTLNDVEGMEKPVLNHWVNAKISKGSAGFSNSKLYDAIEASGNLDGIKKLLGDKRAITDDELLAFLRTYFKGRPVNVVVVVRNKGTDREYSDVKDIVSFLDIKPKAEGDTPPVAPATDPLQPSSTEGPPQTTSDAPTTGVAGRGEQPPSIRPFDNQPH